jgi:hypothetical protein
MFFKKKPPVEAACVVVGVRVDCSTQGLLDKLYVRYNVTLCEELLFSLT